MSLFSRSDTLKNSAHFTPWQYSIYILGVMLSFFMSTRLINLTQMSYNVH